MSELVIYLDLDGVMADYDAGIRALGFKPDPTKKNELNRSGSKDPFKRQMYEAIKGTDFYRALPFMPGAIDLYREIRAYSPIILTAAPKFDATEENYYLNPHWLGASYHKRHWVEHKLLPHVANAHDLRGVRIPIPDDQFICTTSARKFEFMHRRRGEHQVLIDDRVDNCRWWEEAGGHAILHCDAAQTIHLLNEYRSTHGL